MMLYIRETQKATTKLCDSIASEGEHTTLDRSVVLVFCEAINVHPLLLNPHAERIDCCAFHTHPYIYKHAPLTNMFVHPRDLCIVHIVQIERHMPTYTFIFTYLSCGARFMYFPKWQALGGAIEYKYIYEYINEQV